MPKTDRARKTLNPEHRDELSKPEIEHLIAAWTWTAEQLAPDERLRARGEIDLYAVSENVRAGEEVLREALPAGRLSGAYCAITAP